MQTVVLYILWVFVVVDYNSIIIIELCPQFN